MSQSYQARDYYQRGDVVEDYDAQRFSGLKGTVIAARENAMFRAALATLPAGATVLDAPCGTGRFTELAARAGFRVFGGDISSAMLATTRARARAPLSRLDMTALPFTARSFDCVAIIRLFQHLPGEVRRTVLAEAARVTRRSLVLSYFDRMSGSYIRRRLRGEHPAAALGYGELRDELTAVGFTVSKRWPLLRGWAGEWFLLAERAP